MISRQLGNCWRNESRLGISEPLEKRPRPRNEFQAIELGAGCWVLEGTDSRVNHFRRLLIRWEKKANNYLALVHFAGVYIIFHTAGVFG